MLPAVACVEAMGPLSATELLGLRELGVVAIHPRYRFVQVLKALEAVNLGAASCGLRATTASGVFLSPLGTIGTAMVSVGVFSVESAPLPWWRS